MKVSIRFTLPATPSNVSSSPTVWLYYTANYPTGQVPTYRVSLHSDLDGRPNVQLGTQLLAPSVAAGASGWQSQAITIGSSLHSGRVYHIVVEPDQNSPHQINASHNIAIIATRTKAPVPYLPTDGMGAPNKSLFDTCATVLKADPGPDFVVLGETNEGFNPVFALDVLDNGNHVYVGQPYNDHQEWEVWGPNEFGQALAIGATPQQLNYVAFFLTGWDYTISGGCPNAHSAVFPAHELNFRIIESNGTPVFGPVKFLEGNYPNQLFLGRLHWFGLPLLGPSGELKTVLLSANTTYYFVLSAPNAVGPSVLSNSDGWRIAIENSTMGIQASRLPTFMRTQSHAVMSTDGGQTFSHVDTGDMGFIFGKFQDAVPPLAILDDSGIRMSPGCSGHDYVHAAPAGTLLEFPEVERNIGSSTTGPGDWLYMMLRNPGDCLPATDYANPPQTSSPTLLPTNVIRNLEENWTSMLVHYTTGPASTRLLLELGHMENGQAVVDDVIPWEVFNDLTCH